MRNFEGKTAVITGAASGIGKALAEKFAQEKMQVVLADIEEEALEKTVDYLRQYQHRVIGVKTDRNISMIKDVALSETDF